ncbi:MAG: DUF1573 domain-containing protein [Isosphaeraceae bacterium]
MHHAGKILQTSPGQTVERTSTLRNDTDEPIRIVELRKNCACTSISLDKFTIPPHQQALLKVSFKLGNKPGPNGAAITLFTSAPGDSGTWLGYDWDLVTPLYTVPSDCSLGRLDVGRRASARLELRDRGLTLCRDCRVQLAPDASTVSASFQPDTVPPGAGHYETTLSPTSDNRVGSILLSIPPGDEPKDFTQFLDVVLSCKGVERAKLTVPVYWSIRPPVEVHPARLWLGASPAGGKIGRSVVVRSNDNVPFRISSVSAKSGPFRVRGSFTSEAAPEKTVDLDVIAPSQSGIHRGVLDILIVGTAAAHLSLPVSLVVRGK